jgi:hypothetical protein
MQMYDIGDNSGLDQRLLLEIASLSFGLILSKTTSCFRY